MKIKYTNLEITAFVLLTGAALSTLAGGCHAGGVNASRTEAVAMASVHSPSAANASDGDGEEGDDAEVVISLTDLPTSVRAALAGITADGAVTQVTRDTEDEKTTYDVEYTKDGATWAADFSDSGTVLENELDDEGEDGDEDASD